MNRPHCFVASLSFALAFMAGSSQAQEKADPRETVEGTVAAGIRWLEEKDYVTALKNLVSPEELKQVTAEKSLEEFAKGFGEAKAPRLLQVLKEIKDAKPKLDAEGKTATYELKEAIAGKPSITFKKVDKYWYIKN